MKVEIKNATPEEVVKEAMWLAWNACGGTLGMGAFQNKPGADKEAVWKNVCSNGDYPGGADLRPGRADADYVFGRMMKLRLKYTDTTVDIPEHAPRGDYQAWCHGFKTYRALIETAAKNVNAEINETEE